MLELRQIVRKKGNCNFAAFFGFIVWRQLSFIGGKER
jgi:hypothetical protein